MPARPDEPRFYLDECLPHVVADALASVGHPITSAHEQQQIWTLDVQLIPWLVQQGYVWITKDDAAPTEHSSALRQRRLSVVWIRGLDRRRNRIDARELHLILTVKLDQIAEAVRQARGPRWFLLYLGSGNSPVLRPLEVGQPIRGSGRSERSR